MRGTVHNFRRRKGRQPVQAEAAALPVAPTPAPAVPAPAPTPAAGGGKLSLDEAKKSLDKSAETNRNLFFAFNALLATALILCLSITDEHLLIGTTTVKIPLISVDLPIWAFASVVPFFVLVVHFDLLHNLNEHSHKLRAWVVAWEEKYAEPAEPEAARSWWKSLLHNADKIIFFPARLILFPLRLLCAYFYAYFFRPAPEDRASHLSDQIFPFIYDYAWLYEKGKGGGQASTVLLPYLCWALYCWLPMAVLMIFMIRFADLQSYFFTAWHLALLLLDLVWIRKFWPGFTNKQRWLRYPLNSLTWLAGLWTFSLYAMIQYCLDTKDEVRFVEMVKGVIELEEVFKPTYGLTLVPRLSLPSYQMRLPDKYFELAKIRNPGVAEDKLWGKTASPLDLRERRMGFADFSRSVMPYANFEKAKLKFGDLTAADLQGVRMLEAQLQGADLRGAQLQGAILQEAQLQSADLQGAQLQGANLSGAQLQGTVLNYAELQGANLSRAKLRGAVLWGAQLQGAFLQEAQLQGADLQLAQLQGAILQDAQLQGANLANANLAGAIVKDSQWYGSGMQEINGLEATLGTPLFDEKYSFIPLMGSPWAQEQYTQKRLAEAAERSANFTPPALPTPSLRAFTVAWKTQPCTSEAVAKNMLENRPKEIPEPELRAWMEKQAACRPYIQYLRPDFPFIK